MPMLQRVNDWPSRLVAWAERVRNEPHVWGRTDCGTLACAALAEMFGCNITKLKPWATAAEAVQTLDAVGGVEGVMEGLGVVGQTYNFLQSGGIVLDVGDKHFPAIYVYVDPVLVTSHPDTGVEWYQRQDELTPDAVCFNLWEVALPNG